ncbi:MAG TPA: PSD1 and planctomycete cytochrome C domain-containing protein [Bryobacteraceae bacterium]|nr:PSD1 and planctomycete cytochrome C domain-containing protein [Bryobacteraceae bacterium]
MILLSAAWIASPQSGPDFSKEVAPLLQRCVACHNAAMPSSGLRLDHKAGALAGGYSGKVILPGNGAGSRLIKLVGGTEKIVMPPAGPRLKPEEIALLRSWIDAGATWPEGFTFAVSDRTKPNPKPKHWAFIAPRSVTPPNAGEAASIRNPIDRFILARLKREGIAPSPDADRHTLIRRLSLDLTGLPPVPAEMESFLKDSRPEAYSELVDRLLDSPHFGERWARPWLDLARYADSDGYETDQLRPYAWRWRQWVIDSLNRNLPYDQFTIQQIAGDLLPGATLDQKLGTGFHRNTLSNREGGADIEEYRVEQVVDRVATVGTTWLGLTVGCARCHDHKYDPISQKEFFQLYAIFNSADEINIPAPADGEWGEYLREWPAYLKKRQELVGRLESELAPEVVEWERRVLDSEKNPGKDYRWDRQLELLGLTWEGHKGGGQLEGVYILKTPPEHRTGEQRRRLFDYFLRHGSLVNPQKFEAFKVKEAIKQLGVLDKTAPALTMAPVLFENPLPKPNFLHLRGDFRSRGMEVATGIPAVLPPASGKVDRLLFARWLVSRENPLTARVAVNRMWQELFGAGLVLTSEDFGKQGAPPTHPELLDWLAVQFQDSGWNTKKIIKLIVTSAAYRQSSQVRPDLREKDPQNQLLARQSRLRLPAEIIRDQGLAVSGLLSPKIGGPSVHPPQPAAVAMEAFETPWTASRGPDRYRRGIYTWLQRTAPFAQFLTFDAPDPTRACARRERSNTPLQALTLLNDPVFVEMAQAFAERLLRERPDLSPEQRIDYAYRISLGRPARPAEVTRLRQYFDAQRAIFLKERDSASTFFGWSVANLGKEEIAAWAGVASVILNLDEFVTRE